MEVNEHVVKISAGKINIPEPLELDSDVVLKIDGAVTKTEDYSNQDGTIDRVYTVKGIIAEVIKQESF